MAKIQFEVESPLQPEAVLEALTDFSERRPQLWPAIDPQVYRVHEVSASSALVTEGTDVMGGIWARELYEWNGSGTVRATIQESNYWHPGGTWELTAVPRDDRLDPQGEKGPACQERQGPRVRADDAARGRARSCEGAAQGSCRQRSAASRVTGEEPARKVTKGNDR